MRTHASHRSGTGLILGRVRDVHTQAPVPGAALWVRSCTGVSPVDIVRTDANGDFVIRNLPSGQWFIVVSKSGFIQAALRGGHELILHEDERVADLDLFVTKAAFGSNGRELPPLELVSGASIAGRVTDEHGDPLNVTVQVLTRHPETGELAVAPTARPAPARTDPNGAYRVHGLPPGEYVVGVTHGMIGAGTAGHETTLADLQWARSQIGGATPRVERDGGADRLGQGPLTVYAPTFYPSAVTLADAAPIALSLNEARARIDIVVRLLPSISLNGSLMGPDGSVPENLRLALTPARPHIPAGNILGAEGSGIAWSLGGLVTPPVTALGRFSILSLTPGTYNIVAHGTVADGTTGGAPTHLWARKSVTLGEEDVPDLIIGLQPGPATERGFNGGTNVAAPRLAAAAGNGR